jgi:membrane fusion protein (multidrug efflux system)
VLSSQTILIPARLSSSVFTTIRTAITLSFVSLALPSFAADEPSKDAAPAPQGLPAEVIKVVPESLAYNIEAIGSLKANRAVMITPEVAGRITIVNVNDGVTVDVNQSLFEIDASLQKAQLAEAQARVELSEIDFKRENKLYKQKVTSANSQDSAKANVKINQAKADFAKAQLSKQSIIAPFAGIVGIHDISVGDYINPGQPLVELVDLSTLKYDFYLPEIYLSKVKIGQHISIKTSAFTDQLFTGQVVAISPRFEETSRSLLVRAVVNNEDQLLRPGLFATVLLEISNNTKALMIPEQALIPQGTQYFVMRVVDNKVEQVPIVIGQRKDGRVEITQGINPDDVVIIAGQIKLRPGSPVTPLFPEMLKKMGK